jgi:hypothetical protein
LYHPYSPIGPTITFATPERWEVIDIARLSLCAARQLPYTLLTPKPKVVTHWRELALCCARSIFMYLVLQLRVLST